MSRENEEGHRAVPVEAAYILIQRALGSCFDSPRTVCDAKAPCGICPRYLPAGDQLPLLHNPLE